MKNVLYFLCVVSALFAFSGNAFAQSNRHWEIARGDLNIPKNQLLLKQLPQTYKFAVLDVQALYQELSKISSSDVSQRLISIPTPEGNFAEFFLTETSVISPEVAHLYTIKTFKGYAKNSQQVTIRCDISPTGFHAAVFSDELTYVIEPASKANPAVHVVYYKSELDLPGIKCGFDERHRRGALPAPDFEGEVKTPANLRTYRLAIIADATYRTQFGGAPYSATNVLNSFASGINLVNAVYERDLGVHLTLVSNAACADAVLVDHTDIDEVHTFIVNSSGLGSGGFDVGHSLLWANTGGVAYLGVVCLSSLKGGGFSGANGSFTQLYVDYMAHELGHQFGADHTFASSECGTSEPNFRYETGEGSTIMAYAGVCGIPPSYQNFSDPYFHAASIAQINAYISSGGTCAAISTPGTGNNAAPTANAQLDITIPKQTPFILVGSSTDANSDPVTFSWEQFNGSGAATTGSPNCNTTTQPLFRFRPPTNNNYRVFPQMSDVLAGNNNTPAWEKLPCVARTLNFRMTSRDNNTNWGRTASDNMVVTVANTGPFDVTAPNGGQSWEGNTTQAVTWTVNGTDSHCTNVDILVSTNNGVSYTMVGTFPNNGSANITVPNTPSTSARVLVQCSVGGNFGSASTFFDVSNAVFTIIEEGCGSAYWNMTTASVVSNTVDNTSFGDITQGNSNGAVTLISATSPSSGYTGVSGGNNAAVAARTGALNTGASGSAYFEIVVTPNANTIFTLTGVSFGSRSTGTGPQAYSIRTSLDNYGTQVAGGTLLSNSTWALSSTSGLSVASGAGTPITLRIYGYNGTGSPGAGTANWRIDDLTISGCSDPSIVCPTLTSAPGEVQIVNSTCTANCTVTGGSITAPSVGCPTGSSLQYNINGGGWTNNLPPYNTTGPVQTIQTRCSCDADPNTVSPASTGIATIPGACTTPSAPTGTLAIVNSTCSNCTVSGGSIAIGTVSGTGGTLEYSTDGGTTWNAALPMYNQTGPAQTILASVLGTNGCRSNTTQVGQTNPGTCTTPSAPTGMLAIVNSTCSGCTPSGGSIAIGTVSGTGGTLEYSTDGGTTWNAALPMYNQSGPAQTILASVLGANGCRSNTTQVGQTAPATCAGPSAPTGTLAIVNSTCSNCTVGGGSIAIGTVSGTGGTLQYSTDGGTTWNAALPSYNQTGPAQTILASVLDGNGCRSNTTQVGQTTPGTCTTPSAPTGTLTIVNSTCSNCTVGGGSIAIGTVSGTGGTLQYSTDGGTTWNAALPSYNQTGPAQTILASVLGANGCRSNTTQVGQTNPGTCTMPSAPTGTLTIVNSTCSNCTVSGGSIAIGTVSGTGGTLQYSTDGGTTWNAALPSYNQTGPAQTILASVLGANGCRSNTTQVGQTTPGTCPTPSAPTGTLTIVNSTCNNCTVSGGSIAIGTVSGTGGTLQYSTDGGTTWNAALPMYNQTGPTQTILASVLAANGCRSNTTQVGQTTPGTCPTPSAPTGTLTIVNSTCSNCTVSGGSIAIGTVSGTGGTLQYSTDGGTTWNAALPSYNQTGPAQTILASVLGANGCRSNTTQVGQTNPGTCTTPSAPTGTLTIVNSSCINCVVSGGSIVIGTVSGTGGTLQYSTDGGTTWNAALPTYNQTGPAQMILASVLGANGCRSGSTTVGATSPGNCNNQVFTTYYVDADGDNYGTGPGQLFCTNPGPGFSLQAGDCNDNAPGVNPGATEVCDGIDNDCNGTIDDVGGNTSGNWNSANVGQAGGSSNFPPCGADPDDVFNLSATGFSTSSSDNLNAVYQQLCGNGEIIARVLNVGGGGWAGIMLRETLMPGSKKVTLKTQLTSIVRREIRSTTNGPSSILNYNRPGHVWLRLVRSGSNFTGYTSVDGSTWSFAFSATISMNGCVYAGVFAESINVNVTTNASFDNVSIGSGVAPLAGSPDVNPAETHPLIVEENHEFSLRVYPNPTTGEVNLGLEDYQGRAVLIEVYSMLGQLLNFVEIDEVQTTVTELDLSAYQNGAYLIRIATDGAPSVVKWVDKK